MNSADFISRHFEAVHGWLDGHAVHTTGMLLNAQASLGVTGCNVEIGVYRGKYFGAIVGMSPNRDAFGLDVWLYNQRNEAEAFLTSVSSQTKISLFQANTHDISAEQFSAMLEGQRIAFASIDGAHTRIGVMHDLELTESVLSPGGIIAVDDFLSAGCIGVTEGTIEAVKSTGLEPVCFSKNKLYLTTPSWAELYIHHLQMWLQHGQGKTLFNRDGRPADSCMFAGHPVLSF
ncbi:MAG: class I SAM-dependent methyltransferase [Acetobacteraceae bacterium]